MAAKAAKETDRVVLQENVDKLKKKANSWSACLARVFEVFPLICPKYKMVMKPVAVILNDKELVRLLTHLGLSADFSKCKPAPEASQTCVKSLLVPFPSTNACYVPVGKATVRYILQFHKQIVSGFREGLWN